MLHFFSILILLIFTVSTHFAQTSNEGVPISWRTKSKILSAPTIKMPFFDLEAQKAIDAINDAKGDQPWQFGYEFNVDLNINNSGQWNTLENGDRIWQLELSSKDALSMNLIFDDFFLPVGAKVFLFNPETKEYRGAYTSANNNADRMLGTTLVKGDRMVIEYFEPASVQGQGMLNIGMIVHGYRSMGAYPTSKLEKGLNDSGACNHDVACPLGIGWEDQINAVAVIIVGGSASCTGALVNNTSNDGTPYFLSANHCGTSNLGSWVFRFNWDSPVAVCAQNGNSQDPGGPYNEVNGATLRASNSGSDFSLMELNAAPTGNVFYAGWDRSTTPATQTTGIHHPSGDVKKICRENDPVVASTMSGADVWRVNDWDLGVTEPGSSGSPLFNQNGLIIGQLYGGGAACSGTNDNNQNDNYGRFDVSWDGNSANSRLRDWLDPSGTNDISILGYNPNGPPIALDAGVSNIGGIESNFCNVDTFSPEVTIRNFGADTITTVDIIYNVDGAANATYTWNGNLSQGATTMVVLPTITATAGAHTFNVSTTFPNGSLDSNTVNDTRSYAFYITLGGRTVDYTLATDCYGDETTWTLRDSATNQLLYTGGPYNSNFSSTSDTFLTQFCIPDGCYKFTIYDSWGDGLDGSGGWGCSLTGDYYITDDQGNTLVQMTAPNGDFGDSISHYFCITTVLNSDLLNNEVLKLDLLPNPTKDIFDLRFSVLSDQELNIQLIDLAGMLLESRTYASMNQERYRFDLQVYPAGMYLLRIALGDRIYYKKVIKQ